MKKKVLIGHPISDRRLKYLGSQFEITRIASIINKYDQILQLIDDHDALFAISHKVDRAIMEKASKLSLIANYGVGYDNIDTACAHEMGIAVANTPSTTSKPTAEHTFALILSVMRKTVSNDKLLRSGTKVDWSRPELLGHSLEGKTLGIIGMGRIGKEIARIAGVFGLEVVYHNRRRLHEQIESDLHARYVGLEELYGLSDIITIHTPLTAGTRNMVDKSAFQLMKNTAVLINTSRGAVVDEQGLIEALEKGEIASAGLDVFDAEPHIPDRMLALKNVVLTPHTGTGTHEAREAMFIEGWQNIVNYLSGKGSVSFVH